jgi:hypothetical protein
MHSCTDLGNEYITYWSRYWTHAMYSAELIGGSMKQVGKNLEL